MNKHFLLLLFSAWFLLAGGVLAQNTVSDSPAAPPTTVAKDGLFLHISSGPEAPHRVLMALKLADQASASGTHDVFVYFDIKAVELVVQGYPEVNFEGFPSSMILLSRLQERGVPMAASASCLQVIGRTPDQLLPGVKVSQVGAFFGFTQGRILTLDY